MIAQSLYRIPSTKRRHRLKNDVTDCADDASLMPDHLWNVPNRCPLDIPQLSESFNIPVTTGSLRQEGHVFSLGC